MDLQAPATHLCSWWFVSSSGRLLLVKPFNVILVLMSSCGYEAVWSCGWVLMMPQLAWVRPEDALLVLGLSGAREDASAPEVGEGLCNSHQMVEGSSRLMGCHCRWRQWLVYGGHQWVQY